MKYKCTIFDETSLTQIAIERKAKKNNKIILIPILKDDIRFSMQNEKRTWKFSLEM